MDIKPLKSGLKLHDQEMKSPDSEISDLRTLESDFIVKKLEDSIKLREQAIDKRILKK